MSNYPMYSGIGRPHAHRMQLVGVREDGSEVQLRLRHHLWPLDPSRLNNWLAGVKRQNSPVKTRESLRVLLRRYEELRQRGHHDGPPLVGLHLDRLTWKLAPGILPDAEPTTVQRKRSVLAVADTGDATPRRLPPGDVLLNANEASVSGAFRGFRDANLLHVRGETHKKPPRQPGADYATWTFSAPPGFYNLWIRGTSKGDEKTDAVWLALDGLPLVPSAKKGRSRLGLGNWRDIFPAGEQGWSSYTPDSTALLVDLRGRSEHTLVLTARHEPSIVSQIWLSRRQHTPPLFAGPLVRSDTEGVR